jgi:hypothetical protein
MNAEAANPAAEAALGAKGRSAFQWFVSSAGVMLAVTGLATVWTAFGTVKLLTVDDPILGLPFRELLLAVGVVEIAIAWFCFFGKRPVLTTTLVAWFATNLLLYRVGLSWVGWHKPCSCLGNLTDTLHLSPQTADNIMKVVLAYLLIGSYGLLISQWRQGWCQSVQGKSR